MNENIDVPVVPDDASTLADPADAAASSGGDCCHPDDPDSSHQHGYITAKDNYMRRLRRIEGQARGLQRMVEEEQYCIDILTQVSAATKALEGVALLLLDHHLPRRGQRLPRRLPIRRPRRRRRVQPVLQLPHPLHEELVQVRGIDRQELDALE